MVESGLPTLRCTPPPIWHGRAFRQRPQATNHITNGVQEIRRICKEKAILLQASCLWQQEERYWRAAVALICYQAKIPSELAKLYVGGPQILNKIGTRIVAGKWAQNLNHIPGCYFEFKQGPSRGTEPWPSNGLNVGPSILQKHEKSELQTWTRTGPCQAVASSPRHCSGRHALLQYPQ